MKNIFKNILLAATITAGSMSCNKLVEGESISPNDPQSAPAELVLPSAELALGFVHEGEMARLAGMWSGYFTGSDRQYIGLNSYNATAGDFDSPWENLYTSSITNAMLALKEAEEKNNRILAGQAKVVLAIGLGVAADLWGNVPASEVGDYENIPMPKYDDQASVYTYVQTLLTDAIEDIESAQGFGSKNLINTNIEAINTLKAKFYLHAKDYANAYAYAEKGITSSASDMTLSHEGATPYVNANTYWMFLEYDRSGYMTAETAYAPGFIEGRSNAKTDYQHIWNYLYTNEGWYGAPEPNSHPSFWGGQGNGFFDIATNFPITTYHQGLLIKAEAAAREGMLTESLTALNEYRAYMEKGGYLHPQYQTYLEPILDGSGEPVLDADEKPTYDTLAMKYEALTTADFAVGGMLNPDGLAEGRAYIREILAEKYVASVGLLEGFSDLRRTIKENDVRVQVPVLSGSSIPLRFVYPQVEINTNTNMPEVVDLFTPTPVNQ
ncbi:SusD/RagB family nutrient-binding outer membrane lipoprotein [Flammeovirga aprica]|uniref:SusD/RagB family nutrient-binding outer membrane lipoprotein n=1 Tax=Flammeovirga aprica JL-4 TaxID=694437 RepID=A0A7X9P0J5_9BACT|nr:SusD/RagB family nutrient-binding outer membrane lipoprotein [Flammeovirga aprica]NME67326.1 SusD/RagB family nutrient-binding outer membrane lipoprotein [Flammeovirga aprica JL-4]